MVPPNVGDESGHEPEKPRRSRNEMVADAFRNKKLPDDWVDEEDDHDEDGDDDDGEDHAPDFDDEPEQYVVPEPESHRISATASQSVGCLVGAALLIRVAVQASLPSWALVALWVGVLALAGGCLYLLNRLVEEHEREFTVLLPSIGAIVGAIVLLLFGHGVDPNLGGFFDFTVAAAIAAVGYAIWHNQKHFGLGNAIAVTIIELVFTPISIVLSILYFSDTTSPGKLNLDLPLEVVLSPKVEQTIFLRLGLYLRVETHITFTMTIITGLAN